MMQVLNRNAISPKLSQIKQVAQTLRTVRNPMAALNQMLAQNPAAAQVIKQFNDPKAAFYALAEQNGIDPEEILSVLR